MTQKKKKKMEEMKSLRTSGSKSRLCCVDMQKRRTVR
jgi:hypothetical protein